MAERQGLLVGRHLSEVQNAGLNYLLYLDGIQQYRDRAERYRFALTARADYDPKKLFPEYHGPKIVENESEVPEGEETEYDYESVEWQSPSDTDQETLNKMLAMLADASGSVNASHAINDGDGGWV